jgi:AMIN domain
MNDLQIPNHFARRISGVVALLLGVGAIPRLPAQIARIKGEYVARVERVRLLPGTKTSFEIVANMPISAQAQVLTRPDRLVIDVPNAVIGSTLHKLVVGRGGVKDIRVGLFSADPPMTRIVVDWNSGKSYQVLPSGKTVIIKLEDQGSPTRAHGPPTAVVPTSFRSRVERVSLLSDDGVKLEIAANGPIAAETQVVSGPDRLVIDVPNAVPGQGLRNLAVHRGGVKDVRIGLLSITPPVTRIVVDLDAPQAYKLLSSGKTVTVQLGQKEALVPPARQPQVLALPKLTVSDHSGLLSIRADRATLAEVLNEVHRKTGADIAIPPGAEIDEIVVDLGPAPANQVLTSLLNGTRFNYIIVGSAEDPSQLQSVLLTPKGVGVSLAADPSAEVAQGEPHSSASNLAVAGSFHNKNKEGVHSSPPSEVTTPLSPSQPSDFREPSSQPTDQELATPAPASLEQPQPPPGV